MSTLIHRAVSAVVADVEPARRRLRATISTDAIDRFHEVIVPKGIDTRGYMRNPVVLWSHDSDSPPIGRCLVLALTKDGRGLDAVTEFADTEMAREIYSLYEGGFLRAFSIGGLPDRASYSRPTEKEIRARPDLAGCEKMIRKLEMVEYSGCPIPVNREALTAASLPAIIRSIATAPAADDYTPALPGLAGCRTFARAHADLIKRLRGQAGERAAIASREAIERMMGRV